MNYLYTNADKAIATKRLARRYAVLELAETFGDAIDQYLALQDANLEQGRDTEPLPELVPLVHKFPEDLQKAIADARVIWEAS